MNTPLLRVDSLGKTFGAPAGLFGGEGTGVRAVDDVSFDIARGETLAVVGESGCGKSTLGRMLLRLIEPTTGRVELDGIDLTALSRREMRALRSRAQIIFQDPYGSLSPRRRIADIVGEPLELFEPNLSRAQRRERVAQLLDQVGLSSAVMDKLPRQFSGGQRQRIGIARAIALNPAFIVADEPVSALDVSVQAQIINLLQDLQQQRGFSYFFVAHDLAVVRHFASRVMVMYLGRVVEIGDKRAVYDTPHHPYTQALLSAAPVADPRQKRQRIMLKGDVPSPRNIPPGCHFHTRCPLARDICRTERPTLRAVSPGQQVACHFAAPNPIPVTP